MKLEAAMPTTDVDYPAAHSMDTLWFAVDPDGHVAIFETGEPGAVPEDFSPDDEPETIAAELGQALLPVPALRDAKGAETEAQFFARTLEEDITATEARSGLLFLREEPPAVTAAVERGELVRVPTTEGVAVFTEEELDPELARAIDESGALVAIDPVYRPEDGEDEYDHLARLGARGFYAYGASFDVCGPYVRRSVPTRPRTFDSLPTALREAMNPVRLETPLAELLLYQPAEHGPVVSWEAAWLSTDLHTVRQIEGREDDYREAYEHRDETGGVVWEEPGAVVSRRQGLARALDALLADPERKFVFVQTRDDPPRVVQIWRRGTLRIECLLGPLSPDERARADAVFGRWPGAARVARPHGGDAWQLDVGTDVDRATTCALELAGDAFGADPETLQLVER